MNVFARKSNPSCIALGLLGLFFCLSCRRDKPVEFPEPTFPVEYKTLNLTEFLITIPSTWEYVPQTGIDSYVGKILLFDGQHAMFDLGWYSNDLNVDSSSHEILMDSIDNKPAKIVYPLQYGNGTTGVYFSSLPPNPLNEFQLSGINLSDTNQHYLLEAIQTLDFVE